MKKTLLLFIFFWTGFLFAGCGSGNDAAEAPPMAAQESSDGAGLVLENPTWQMRHSLSDSGSAQTSAERYLDIRENQETSVNTESMLTLSLKVDTASYTNVERYINNGGLPPANAVRTEELINYFNYETPMTFTEEHPFAIYTEVGPSIYNADRLMAFTRIKTEEIDKSDLPPSHLIFLIDTSGSMNSYDKLPLLKDSFKLLVETLGEEDLVSIVTYANNSYVMLEAESGASSQRILTAIEELTAGGSTAGANGIMTAYEIAETHFIEGGNNRIILATDGDFNVGISNTSDLAELVARKRENGIYLSVLGFGTGNIRDDIMETLAKNGSGNYSYINSLAAANKVLVEELGTNLFTAAEDVKAQVEFNPENVKSYRLVGYENRLMDNRDFDDDTKDAGEVGAGTDVVILFEIELHNAGASGYKYLNTAPEVTEDSPYASELFEVRIRYKEPGRSESIRMTHPVTFDQISRENTQDYLFACSVAAFGDLLRGSAYADGIEIDDLIQAAQNNTGRDPGSYRRLHAAMLRNYEWITRE